MKVNIMKVYIIREPYDGSSEGIYSSREKAEKHLYNLQYDILDGNSHYSDYYIDEEGIDEEDSIDILEVAATFGANGKIESYRITPYPRIIKHEFKEEENVFCESSVQFYGTFNLLKNESPKELTTRIIQCLYIEYSEWKSNENNTNVNK